MKKSKRKEIQRKEVEDALGIKRGVNTKPLISFKVYRIIRICLIAALPVVYFLCSPFIIVVLLAWIALLFITRSLEKNYNAGLKKDLCTKLPKTDSVLCILLVILVSVSATVSSLSTTTRKTPFEGITSEELQEKLDGFDFDDSQFVWIRIESKLKDIGSVMTGTRWLFQEERGFRGGPGGGFGGFGGKPDMGNFEPPEGMEPPTGGKPDMSEMLSNMPFSMVFESIVKAVSTGMLIAIIVVGILSLRKMSKLDLSDEELTEKQRKKRRLQEEKRLAEENAKKNFFSVEKANFSEIEKELLADLAFLFETDEEQIEQDSEE